MPAPNRLAPPPPANTPVVDAFAQQVAQLATKFRIATVAFVAVDPQTQQQKLYATQEAIVATRGLVAEKYGLADVGETAWGE